MGLAALVPISNFKKERGRDFRVGYALILGRAHIEQAGSKLLGLCSLIYN